MVEPFSSPRTNGWLKYLNLEEKGGTSTPAGVKAAGRATLAFSFLSIPVWVREHKTCKLRYLDLLPMYFAGGARCVGFDSSKEC